jgi:hypothetical protein
MKIVVGLKVFIVRIIFISLHNQTKFKNAFCFFYAIYVDCLCSHILSHEGLIYPVRHMEYILREELHEDKSPERTQERHFSFVKRTTQMG